jgi:hypothetical protein
MILSMGVIIVVEMTESWRGEGKGSALPRPSRYWSTGSRWGECDHFAMLIHGYIDDSADQSKSIAAVAGAFLGNSDQWNKLTKAWDARLVAESVNYYRSTYLRAWRGPFFRYQKRDLYTVEEARFAETALRSDLEALIKESGVIGFGHYIPLEMYNRVRQTVPMAGEIFPKDAFEVAIQSLIRDCAVEFKHKIRVAGPFTVESLSPHRVLAVDENDDLIGASTGTAGLGKYSDEDNPANFVQVILENLRSSGVQQAHKQDKIVFSSLSPWPGTMICAEGRCAGENWKERRAGILIGPEFGTVSREDLVQAAREAGDAAFDLLIACAFNYDAHSSEFNKLGRIPVLKSRMNADLHMATDLKNTGKGNLFVIFGESDITILEANNVQIQVKVNGVDVFHPSTGEVHSDGADGIACWFVDSDYNEESFFVRQAYFLGANDPYKALKTTLKAEINEEAWATLHSDTSRPFDKPASGRIAVKVINHLGDEVMKVFRVTP